MCDIINLKSRLTSYEGYSEETAKELVKQKRKEIKKAANAIAAENRHSTVWNDGTKFPDRTLNAQMEAQYVAAVMNCLERDGKIDSKKYGSVTVLTHADGSVSVGFSGHINSKVSTIVNDELSRLNNLRASEGVEYSKKYTVSSEGIPKHMLYDINQKETVSAPTLNRCGEPKAMAVARQNSSSITGIDVVWRGESGAKYITKKYRDNRLLYVYPQMEPCKQCKRNVSNYYAYAVEKVEIEDSW